MGAKVELLNGKPLRDWLIIGSVTAVSAGFFVILLLTMPLVVFEGDFISGSAAISWYSLRNYGESIYHPGLSSIQLLSIPAFATAFFNILVGCLNFRKALKRETTSHILIEMLIGALEVFVIIAGVLYSLRLNIVHATSVLPTSASGVNSAGRLVVSDSIKRETLPSILISQLYPLILLSILLLTIAYILGHEITRLLPTKAQKTDEFKTFEKVLEDKA